MGDVMELDLTVLPGKILNVPRWATETYPEMEKDISEYIHAAMFQRRFGDKPLSGDSQIMRANSEALAETMVQTIALKAAVERAEVWQAIQADKTAFFRLLPGEYNTISEWLTEAFGDLDGDDSRAPDVAFWLEKLLPKLEKLGVPPEEVVAVPQKFSKARAATPALRRAMDAMGDEEFREYAAEILDDISSDMSVRDFKDKLRGPDGSTTGRKKDDPFDAYETMMTPEETWVVIKVVGDRKEQMRRVRAIEILFGPLLNKRMVDPLAVVQEAGTYLLKNKGIE